MGCEACWAGLHLARFMLTSFVKDKANGVSRAGSLS